NTRPSALFSFVTDPPPPAISTLSLHDALPISPPEPEPEPQPEPEPAPPQPAPQPPAPPQPQPEPEPPKPAVQPPPEQEPDIALEDRKSTRLNSSHVKISYAVFCLKKKKNKCVP